MNDLFFWQCPQEGLAVAITLVRAQNEQSIPDLANETVYCSIASRSAECSLGILSNSSMQQTPLSASTRAPASIEASSSFFETEHVSPHVLVPVPFTQMHLGATREANLSSWDLPYPGSPISRQWQFQRQSNFILEPDIMVSSMPAFTISLPQMVGQKECMRWRKSVPISAILLTFPISS